MSGLSEKAINFVRKYAGEQVASHLIQAHGDLDEQVREGVGNKMNMVKDKVNILNGSRMIVIEQFGNLFNKDANINEYGNGLSESSAELWISRSSNYLDNLTPQGRVWYELSSKTSLLDKNADLSFAFDSNIRLDDILERQIQLDIPRTYPDLDYFQDESVKCSFENILRATAITCPEVGYVQGMNFLIAYLMLHCKTDRDTHRLSLELLTNPKYLLRGLFEEGLPALRLLSGTLKEILEKQDNELYLHLENLGFDEYFFSFQWISTIFAYSMPLDALQLVWDLFFEKGWHGFFAISVVLISDRRSELLKADFDEACAVIKRSTRIPRQDFHIRASDLVFPKELQELITEVIAKM